MDLWLHGKGVQGSRRGFGFKVAVRGSPVATVILKTTERHAGALRGSGGVVTVWSRVCAWVHVFPQTGDGPSLRAPGVERHG